MTATMRTPEWRPIVVRSDSVAAPHAELDAAHPRDCEQHDGDRTDNGDERLMELEPNVRRKRKQQHRVNNRHEAMPTPLRILAVAATNQQRRRDPNHNPQS